ncbi:MAG: hypothetical protein ACFFHD_07260 [Promethearchaeota archaeon]
MNWGITFYVALTFFSFFATSLFFTGFFLYADIHFFIGSLVGTYLSIKNRNSDESITTYGLLVGILGAFISAFFISLYVTIIYVVLRGIGLIVFFYNLLYSSISGLAIGSIVGALMATYFNYKDVGKEKKKKDDFDNDFFKDLIEE